MPCANVFFRCLLLAFAICETTAIKWLTSGPEDGRVFHACTNANVTFAWGFTSETGDIITSTEWTYNGRSQEMVAASIHGNFFATPSFSHRVQFVPSAGILLNHVTKMDSGNYSVTVAGHDSSGVGFIETRSIVLSVADDLMTTDRKLHASLLADAEYVNSTDQFHIVLTCGNFTYSGDPPFVVEWLTPDGHTYPSTSYSGGLFKYLLPNPPTQGSYTCRVPLSSLPASCSQNSDLNSSVAVDGLLARLVLLESRQAALVGANARKDEVISELRTELDGLRANQSHLMDLVDNLTSCCQDIAGPPTPSIAFTARLDDNRFLDEHQKLILGDVLINVGNAYQPSNGIFTAPVTGTYFFAATATPYGTNHYASITLRSNSVALDDFVFNSYARTSDNGFSHSASLQGALTLQKGEQVWLAAAHSYSYFWSVAPTVFSGFLMFVE